MESNLPVPTRALAVAAHPDDVEFGCGGTLAKWAAKGCEIFHLVCTDGSKGPGIRRMTRPSSSSHGVTNNVQRRSHSEAKVR